MITFGQLSPATANFHNAWKKVDTANNAKVLRQAEQNPEATIQELKTKQNPAPLDFLRLSQAVKNVRNLRGKDFQAYDELMGQAGSASWSMAEQLDFRQLNTTLDALAASPLDVDSLVDHPLRESLDDKLSLKEQNAVGLILDKQQ